LSAQTKEAPSVPRPAARRQPVRPAAHVRSRPGRRCHGRWGSESSTSGQICLGVRVITLIDGTPGTKVEGTESASAFPVSVSPHVVGRSMETAGATPGQVRAVIRRRAATEPPCAPRGCVLAHAPRALDVPARHTEEAHTPGAPISNSRSKSPPFRAAQVHGIRSFFNCHDN